MSKVIKLLKDFDECQTDGLCFNKMIRNCNKGDLFFKLQEILEENKENINFVWVNDPTLGSKYHELSNKICDEIGCLLCLGCSWKVISKYNDKPLGKKIPCFN